MLKKTHKETKMKIGIYAVYDKKAKAYMPPWECQNNAVAIRKFGGAVNDEKSFIHRYPDDFDLYHIAFFDDNSGRYENVKEPVVLAKATDVLVQRPDTSIVGGNLDEKRDSVPAKAADVR